MRRPLALLCAAAFLVSAPTAWAEEPAPPPPPPGPVGAEVILGQAPEPSVPGAVPGTPPPLTAWNNGYLLPQSPEPAVPTGAENTTTSQWDYLRRLWDMHQSGGLRGALLGQAPADQRPELQLPG